MQNFEALFRRAWERSREPKLSWYILLGWLLLCLLLAAGAAAVFGAYHVLLERKFADQSVIDVNPELRQRFVPKRELDLHGAKFSFGSRIGDRLRNIAIRTGNREIRAKSAELRLDGEQGTIALVLHRYRVHEVEDGIASRRPVSGDDWGVLEMVYQFDLPAKLRRPEPPIPGDISRALVALSAVALAGATLWFWLWRIIAAGTACEAVDGPPTRIGRGFLAGLSRWRSVLFPLPLITLCAVVSFVGSLPNILQLPLPFYLTIYPLAWALEITLLILCGIVMIGVAAEPPETSFGVLLRHSVRVFLGGWGRYLLGMFWVYAFLAVFAVMLMPGLVPLLHAGLFDNRLSLIVAIVWLSIWFAALVVAGLRVQGCFSAYCMYLYLDVLASGTAEKPEKGGAA